MTFFLIFISNFFLSISNFFLTLAQTPYLDRYFFATVMIVATVAINAVVIERIYSFKGFKGNN